MSAVTGIVPDVFTPREIADAAAVSVREVRALVASGSIHTIDGTFVWQAEAVRAVRIMPGGTMSAAGVSGNPSFTLQFRVRID